MIARDVYVLIYMVATGAFCALVFDMIRAIQSVSDKNRIIVSVTDILYWAFVAFSVAYSITVFNDGILRAYEIIGIILGAIIYFCTLSFVVYRIFYFITCNIVKIIGHIFKILLTLLGFLYKIVVVPMLILFRKIKGIENSENGGADERIKG